MQNMTLTKRSLPPKPEARKDNPINAEFEEKAKAFLRTPWFKRALDLRNWQRA